MIQKIIYFFTGFLIFYFLIVSLSANGFLGRYESAGEVTQSAIPQEAMQKKVIDQIEAKKKMSILDNKMILFGDLHVHTTYSDDAFMLSLPMLSGEGTHPPADACDFARFCSSLDFWANTDHAETLTSVDWKEITESVQQCNMTSGSNVSPDTVAFLGWEWSQVGGFSKPHFGHKNIILKGIDDDEIPSRPIGSDAGLGFLDLPMPMRYMISAMRPADRRVHDMMRFMVDGKEDYCDDNVPVRELPLNCKESAATPEILFDKLNDWGHENIVIPHGTARGAYTPPGADRKKQLTDQYHDANLQTMVEVYSGHGNSEEYRDWRSVKFNDEGEAFCPKPSRNFLPGCWQAGKIIEKRCLLEGESKRECIKRAKDARENYAIEGVGGSLTIFGEAASEWLDANQCKDCFLPAFNFRPAGSVQYMLALRNFNPNDTVSRFRFGIMASSDNHTARPGTGYKEINRREMTEAAGPGDSSGYILRAPEGEGPYSKSIRRNWSIETLPSGPKEPERTASFFQTGGLIATHSNGKKRNDIWNSLKRKEIYATSGTRILLWFDLINPPNQEKISMGSSIEMDKNPRFLVKAVGSFKQKPGCPEYSINALGKDRLNLLCRNECYNPSDIRNKISRIEVIRIKPQSFLDEDINNLVEDNWKVFKCNDDESGCSFTFTDNEFNKSKRDVVYYVRAIEERSKAINASGLRCEYDKLGNCIKTNICSGSSLETPYEDDCLAEVEERAWSSPIFIDYSEI